MSTVTENDLKELKDLIKAQTEQLNNFQKDVAEFRIETKISIESLKGDINALDEKLTGKVNALDEKLTGKINILDEKLTGKINTLDEKLTGNIKAVNERTAGMDKRLDNQEFVSRGILIALVVAILGGFAKLFGFIGNL